VNALAEEIKSQEEQISLLANKAECGLIKLAYNSEMTILYANDFFLFFTRLYKRRIYTIVWNQCVSSRNAIRMTHMRLNSR